MDGTPLYGVFILIGFCVVYADPRSSVWFPMPAPIISAGSPPNNPYSPYTIGASALSTVAVSILSPVNSCHPGTVTTPAHMPLFPWLFLTMFTEPIFLHGFFMVVNCFDAGGLHYCGMTI